MSFQIIKESSFDNARLGKISTLNGEFFTPIFMPPATRAVMKSLAPIDLDTIGIEIVLINTLHLHLRPGEDFIEKFGGTHKFMNWQKPILSDSGGFQIWSMGKGKNNRKLVNITENGAEFTSPINGAKHFLTPEKSIEIQHKLGANIIMCFDECTPNTDNKDYAKKAMERTHRWTKRSLQKHNELKAIKNSPYPLLFGIIQGGAFEDLRKESAEFITSMPFDGIALGGETIGFDMPQTIAILDWLKSFLPKEKPIYTMGLGANPQNIIEVVKRGIDMFDCVSPARLARHGELYNGLVFQDNKIINFKSEFEEGFLKIKQSRFKEDKLPIDEKCDCYTCQNFSRAYLRYLFLIQEPLYLRLATIHNFRFIMNLIHLIRKTI